LKGIPVTAAVRTIVDLARVYPATKVGPMLDYALARRLVTRAQLEARASGRRHDNVLRELLEERPATARPMGSEFEAHLFRGLQAAGLPLPVPQYRVLMPDGCRDEFLAYWDREASAVPMSRVSHIDHRQIITVQVNDRDVRALIDSGAYRSMIDAASAGRLGVTRETSKIPSESRISGVGPGKVDTWVAPFRKVVIVTSREREVEIRAALQLGIRGYVLLGTDLREFVEGMRAVARGAHFLSRSATHRIASSLSYSALTRRECDVLQLLVEGHGNKQIAAGLGIATETAKCHVKAILDKLGASTRTQAASIAMSRGLVHSGAAHALHPIALAGVEKRFAA